MISMDIHVYQVGWGGVGWGLTSSSSSTAQVEKQKSAVFANVLNLNLRVPVMSYPCLLEVFIIFTNTYLQHSKPLPQHPIQL